MRHSHIPAAPIAAFLLGCAAVPAAAVIPADGDPILWWNQTYLDSLPFPTGFQRNSASFNIAMHDAVNTTLGRPNYAYKYVSGVAGGDARAAAAQAAHDTLMVRAPAQAAVWTAALDTQLALIPEGAAKDLGRSTGAKHAAAILALRANDGTGAPTPYAPSGLPGGWAPTPPAFAPAANPWLGNVTPWLATSNAQFRPGPPPSLDSTAYAVAFEEVKSLGATASLLRTAEQTSAALFWGATPGARIYMRAAVDQAEAEGLSTIENAALFARLHVALADATQHSMNSAYYYDFWRPYTAIRAADTDGNAATIADPLWTSLAVPPPFQSYTAIPVAIGGAMAGILEATFGGFSFCDTYGMQMRCFSTPEEAALESLDAAVWGGGWWRFDGEAGLAMGQNVASWTLAQNAFGAVPEPATWALLISGFGIVGMALRRRNSANYRFVHPA